MLKLIPDAIKLPAAAVVGAILCFAVFTLINTVWWLPMARAEGRDVERIAQLKRSMELIQQRSKTNAEIGKLDAAGLCAALDGQWVHDHCE
jgi:hypothetical protein